MKNRKKSGLCRYVNNSYQNIDDPVIRQLLQMKDETIELQQKTIKALGLSIDEINCRINQRLEALSNNEPKKGIVKRINN